MLITKEEFLAYEDVRVEGETNMWDTETVSDLSGLDRLLVCDIMANYKHLHWKYLEGGENE